MILMILMMIIYANRFIEKEFFDLRESTPQRFGGCPVADQEVPAAQLEQRGRRRQSDRSAHRNGGFGRRPRRCSGLPAYCRPECVGSRHHPAPRGPWPRLHELEG